MRLIVKHTFLYVLLGFVSFIKAQDPVIQHMSKISNLPDVKFYDIIEDNDKNIWLSANKGLFKYNGKTYKKYTNSLQKVSTLFNLKLDNKGKLWCNNIYGQFFYVENDSLKLFFDAHELVKGQLSPFEIDDNAIKLYTTDGVYAIHLKDKKVTKLFKGMVISKSSFKDISHIIKVSTHKTSSKKHQKWYQIKNNKLKLLLDLSSKLSIQSPKVFTFKDGTILNFKEKSKNKFLFYNVKLEKVIPLQSPKNLTDLTIYNIIEHQKDYWFLTTSGVFVYQIKANQFVFKEQMFSSESITDFLVDFNNNYWFTTLDNGVFVSTNLKIRQVNLQNYKDKITAQCLIKNNQFILGTNTGKLLFYHKNKLIKTIQLHGVKIIGNLFFDKTQNRIIVSINATESYSIDLNTYKIIDQKNKFSVAKTFSKINDDNLFYGNYKEAILYHKPFTSDSSYIIRANRVKTSQFVNPNLYVSFLDGLYQFNTKNLTSTEIKYNGKDLLVNSMATLKDEFWFATQQNKLFKLNKDQALIQHNILPKELQINRILSEGEALWISTNKGFYKYKPSLNQLQKINIQDGLPSKVDQFIILKDYLVLIFPNSFYIMPKDKSLFRKLKTAKVNIVNVKINDKDTIVQNRYSLPYNNNNIRFDFNSNGFQSANNVQYKYRIKPIDTIWHNVPTSTNFVVFNSLSSGKYTFELKGQNMNSNNVEFAQPITLTINKPFWETYLFKSFLLFFFFGIIWMYFKWRLKQKETQKIAEIDKILMDKKITHLKLENLRSQMNPHFIFNALNSIQDYIISNEKDLASSYLVKFSRLIRMYLEYSQQNEITLQEELNALKLYLELEKVRFENELNYELSINKELPTNHIKVPSLFIQPYVENALKHGLLHKLNNRVLKIIIKKNQHNKLQIIVEDNGIGRQQSEKLKQQNNKHKPFATSANQERVYLYKNKLNKDITIEIKDLYNKSKVAQGTRVVITMPI